jgi:para-aminobenzoate synthetase component I
LDLHPATYPPNAAIENAAVSLINRLNSGMLLSSGGFTHDAYARWDVLAALGAVRSMVIPFNDFDPNAFDAMQHFIDSCEGWCFFHLSYDLKNTTEKLSSGNSDRIRFPELVIFSPEAVFGIRKGNVSHFGNPELIATLLDLAGKQPSPMDKPLDSEQIEVMKVFSAQQYIEAVQGIKHHIHRGDIYELNFCQEFFAEISGSFDPGVLYARLSDKSKAPFSAYYRWKNHCLVSSSPERFLQRTANQLISQPIKGTIRRGRTADEDLLLKQLLLHDTKERSENVMIVDLVRNDLSRVAEKGSVSVPELFGIYTFPSVHQMISTVGCRLAASTTIAEILRATFPMGSMTGAPKISAMKLIDQFERSRRGLFSGSIGYISPEGDFDMNVVIRSILCNFDDRVLSAQTGGAITAASDPKAEYAESLLKAEALLRALGATLQNP